MLATEPCPPSHFNLQSVPWQFKDDKLTGDELALMKLLAQMKILLAPTGTLPESL